MLSGTLDVDGLLRTISARQFFGWQHFAEVEPFTFNKELRADYRTASIVQMIANVNRGKRKAYSLDEFLLKFDDAKPPAKKTWQEMQKVAYMIAAAYNAPGVTG
jgi:hypothetical protein